MSIHWSNCNAHPQWGGTENDCTCRKAGIPPSHIRAEAKTCGSFGCVLPAGHNQGKADIPANHEFPDRWAAPRRISADGRVTVGAAVSMDRDWNLTRSAVDKLVGVLGGLSDEDLDSAYTMSHSLREAIACVQLQRETERLKSAGRPVTLNGYRPTE